MSYWKGKRVFLTGASGFLGKHVTKKLEQAGCTNIYVPRSRNCDLRNMKDAEAAVMNFRPDIVIHMAAICGGIQANKERPGTFFYDNATMGINIIEASRRRGVPKIVVLGTICAYPKFTPVPFKEDYLWAGYPEETNAPYGLAKKMLLVQLQAYRQQYSFNGIYLLPVNLYGPGDNFDLQTSHVIPAMIRKFIEADEVGDEKVTLWGTGEASREFLYVEDCAEGIIQAAELYNRNEPVNIGSGNSITIKNLAEIIKDEIGYEGKIEWDTSKPNGQPERQLDISRAKSEFGFSPKTQFSTGLKKTIEWFLKNRN